MIKLSRQKSVVFSDRCQTSNNLIEAGIDVQQVLVNWQLHTVSPSAKNAFAAGDAIAWDWPGASAFDVMLESPAARRYHAVMTFLTLASREGKLLQKWHGVRRRAERHSVPPAWSGCVGERRARPPGQL